MIRDINKLVNIPGELNSPAEGNIVTWSKGVYDYPLEMDLLAINSHVYEIEDELDNIANEVNTINQSINEINSTNNRIITINKIDTLINGDLYKSTNPINYAVITPFISDNYKVGNLVLVSNDTGEKLVQIFATSLEYDNLNGTLNVNNYDDNIVLIYRIYNNLTRVGQESGWTRWNYVNENITNESIKYTDLDLTGIQKMTVLSNIGLSIFDEINSSNLLNEPNQYGLIPAFPKRVPSLKAVWDLFKTIENTGLLKVSFENLNSLGDLEDTTTDKSSLYTIYNIDLYDLEYAEGLLFVYADLNSKLISQIVIGPYEINPSNHRALLRIVLNDRIGKFNILSRNRPYENASSRFSEWFIEDYVGYVKYNASQELTESYKNIARENIGITIDDDTSDNEAVLLPDNSTGLPTSRYVQKALNALQNIIMTTITQSIDSVNSDINDLNDDVSENTTNINNINENITNINEDITDINENITNINGDITDINNDINSINENINNINNDVDSLTEQLNGLGNSIISYNLNKDVTTDNENNLIFANRYTADGSKNLVYLPENLIYQGIPYISSIVNGIYNNVSDNYLLTDDVLEQSVIWDTNSRKFYLMVRTRPHQINQVINVVYYRNWSAVGIYYSSDYYINNINNQNITFYVQDDNWGSLWGNDSHWIKIINNLVLQAQAPNNLQVYNWISADTFEEENTIYVIRYNFNLKNTSASIGNNSVLRFEGGKLYNGTLIGNSSVYLDLNEAVSTQSMEVFSGNFANYGDTYPENPYIGQIFFNTNLKKLLVWDGNRWIDSNGKLPIQNSGTTLPTGLTSSDKGTIFYKEGDGLYYWNGSDWKPVGLSGIIKVNELPESGNEDIIYFNTSNGIAYVWDDNEWKPLSIPEEIHKGTSSERPTDLTSEDEGYMYYDTTLHKPIFWNGELWIDANGNTPANKRGTVLELPTNLTQRDLGYTFYNTDDEVLLYYVLDSKGNDLWLDSLLKDDYNYTGNNYGIIEFEKFLDDDLTIYEFGQGTGKEYYELQQNTVNPVNEELTFKIYAHKNNPYFVAILDSNWETIGTGTIFKPVKHELFCNWLEAPGILSRIWYEKTFGVTTATDVPYTTPYYKDKSTGIIYRYNKNLHRFESVISTLPTRGTILERPTNLPSSAVGVFKYYDTTLNKTLTYGQDDSGNDLWFDSTGNNYSIVPISGILQLTVVSEDPLTYNYPLSLYDELGNSIGDLNDGGIRLMYTTFNLSPMYMYLIRLFGKKSFFIVSPIELTEELLNHPAESELTVYNIWRPLIYNHIVDSEYIQSEFTIEEGYDPNISKTIILYNNKDKSYYLWNNNKFEKIDV